MRLLSSLLLSLIKKRQVGYIHVAFAYFFLISFYFFFDQLAAPPHPTVEALAKEFALSGRDELYDPRLGDLTSVDKVIAYTDSLTASVDAAHRDSSTFPTLLSSVLRRRFHHGYSYFGPHDIQLASLVAKVTITDLHAIVLPDEILRHAQAACSQQSIVCMAVLRRKGYQVRKVGFLGPKEVGGHFALEAHHNGSWHYYDSNLEPDSALLAKHNRPSIAALVSDRQLLHQVYAHRLDSTQIASLFPTYQVGEVNASPAPRAHAFQLLMKWVTYGAWVVVLLLWGIFSCSLRNLTLQPIRLHTSVSRHVPINPITLKQPASGQELKKSICYPMFPGHFNYPFRT
ncbi:hypothetical protein [Hymenobacter tenuis]